VRNHYRSDRIIFSLRTKSANQARKLAAQYAFQLDTHWANLRLASADHLSRHVIPATLPNMRSQVLPVASVAHTICVEASSPVLTKAADQYLKLKGNNRPKTFATSVHRVVAKMVEVAGNKPIGDYVRSDVNRLRDVLISEGKAGSTVVRMLGTLKAIVSFICSEHGLEMNSAFSRTYVDGTIGVKDRNPFDISILKGIQLKCRDVDDERRWLIALVSDTGMRLAEAVGLLRSDLQVRDGIPCVMIKPHPWRRLKTSSSERVVPLVGNALWAQDRILSVKMDSKFAFPSYCDMSGNRSDSASAALNKWIKTNFVTDATIHGFRHSMRDRLRSVQCPSEIIDEIGGWQTPGVGSSYGKGYPLGVINEWMEKISI
jgi:integrase